MHFLTNFYLTTTKYYVINKFVYKQLNILPKLDKIILSLGSKSINNKKNFSGLLLFELISSQKACITKIKTVTINKENPISFKITLKKQNLFNLFYNFLINIILLLNNNLFNLNKNTIYLKINNIFNFLKLETYYSFFNLLPNFNIIIIANATSKKETAFFYKLFYFKIT